MFVSLRATLARWSRWPRRLAALGCLALAAASALGPPSRAATHRAPTTADLLRAGEVAISVSVTSTPSALQRGDHIGLLTGADDSGRAPPSAAVIADRLRVLAAPRAGDGADTTSILVAADRATAVRIAANTPGPMLVVLDKSP